MDEITVTNLFIATTRLARRKSGLVILSLSLFTTASGFVKPEKTVPVDGREKPTLPTVPNQGEASRMACLSEGAEKHGVLRKIHYNGAQPVAPLPPVAFAFRRSWSSHLASPNKMPQIPAVKDLQPTLSWRTLDSSATKFDLTVAEGVMTDICCDNGAREPVIFVRGTTVYQREAIEGCSHRLETSLSPNTVYVWAVRVRKGSVVGPWSTYNFSAFMVGASANLWWAFRTPK